MSSLRPRLGVENVGKHYPNGTRALAEVSFDVDAGTLLAVVGHNGAGKSTLLNIVSGLIRPTTGTVRLTPPDQRVNWAPQRTLVDWSLTVRQNVDLVARLTGTRRGRVTEVLALLDLEQVQHHQAENLSGGQLQRAQIARALVAESALYVLDEPAAGLDPAASEVVMTYLRTLADEGRTVLVSSHDLDAVERTNGSLLLLDSGRVLAHLPIGEFVARAGATLAVRVVLAEPLAGPPDWPLPDGWRLSTAPDRRAFTLEVPLADGLHDVLAWLPPGLAVLDLTAERQSLRDVYLARYAAPGGYATAQGER